MGRKIQEVRQSTLKQMAQFEESDFLSWHHSPNKNWKIGLTGFLNDRDVMAVLSGPNVCIELKRLEQPQEAAIIDEGYSAISDWLSNGNLCGRVLFFGPHGELVHLREISANIGNLFHDLSSGLVFVTTCIAPSEDSCVVMCFEIKSGTLLWKVPVREPAAFLFPDSQKRAVYVCEQGSKSKSEYFLEIGYEGGKVLEEQDPRLIHPKSGYDFMEVAFEKNKTGNFVEAKDLAEKALTMGVSEYCKGQLFRLLGEIAERNGLFHEALRNYELALDANPKIGLVRRIKTLRSKSANN